MTSKQFWRLVKRTVKKRGILRVVRDAQGRLATDRARIEEIVLEEGSAIFSQRTAHQRDGRKTIIGWQEWMKDTVDHTIHENQVC